MPKHYKSTEGYEKAMAYIHMHDIPHEHHKYVEIAGHKHKVSKSRE